MSVIVFIRYVNAPKSFESYLMSECPQQLEGDWLNPPPDLNTCERYLRQAVEKLVNHKSYKYSNPVKVIRENDCAFIQSEGIKSGTVKKICGYKISKSLISDKNEQSLDSLKTFNSSFKKHFQ